MVRAVAVVLALLSAPAAADECAAYGPMVFVDPAIDVSLLPENARLAFTIIDEACNEIPGPTPEVRLVSGGVVVAADVLLLNGGERLLAPQAPLPLGAIVVEARTPADATTLGPWREIARGVVVKARDTRAPRLGGALSVWAEVEAGAVPLRRGEATTGWRIRLRARFEAAVDDLTSADGLVYAIDGKPSGGAWREVTGFRPDRDGKRARHSWSELDGWGETWTYRLRVRDAAGNETVGPSSKPVKRPAKPQRAPGSSSRPRPR